MKIALISDLHGNEVALQAVLDDIRQGGVDRIVCLGDVATLGPRPAVVLQMLRDAGCSCILGNHDEFLLDPDLIHSYTELPVIVDAVDWCRGHLSGEDLAFVRGFAPHLPIDLDGVSTLFVFHGSPRSHMENILSTTPPAELDQLLAGHHAPVMAGGHTHIQMLRQHRGMLLVNPGSVGMAFKEHVAGGSPTLLPHAEYATVEALRGRIQVALHRVPLDQGALRDTVRSSDNPLGGWLLQQYA